MAKLFNVLALALGTVGLWLAYFFGPLNGLLITLLAFIIADYVTGVAAAAVKKRLDSNVGFKGIIKKVIILLIVGVANLLDVYVLGANMILRSAVIFFYIANEGLSIIENAGEIGLPIPKKLREILAQLRDKNDEIPQIKIEDDTEGPDNE